MSFDDEICECGHSKGYHKSHDLDEHGGECEGDGCLCELYTWARFVKYEEWKQ